VTSIRQGVRQQHRNPHLILQRKFPGRKRIVVLGGSHADFLR